MTLSYILETCFQNSNSHFCLEALSKQKSEKSQASWSMLLNLVLGAWGRKYMNQRTAYATEGYLGSHNFFASLSRE